MKHIPFQKMDMSKKEPKVKMKILFFMTLNITMLVDPIKIIYLMFTLKKDSGMILILLNKFISIWISLFKKNITKNYKYYKYDEIKIFCSVVVRFSVSFAQFRCRMKCKH